MRKLLLLLPFLLTACVHVNTDKAYHDLSYRAKQVTHHHIVWQQSTQDRARVKNLLRGGLTENKAIRIALMNNLELQAKFESLGITQADLVQAGLWQNPSLDTLFRFPIGGTKGGTGIDAGLMVMISDIWNIPIKKKIASFQAQQVTHAIIQEIIKTTTMVRHTYNDYIFQRELQRLSADNMKLFQQEIQTQRQHYSAGFVNKLEQVMLNNAALAEKLEYTRAQNQSRQVYAKLMHYLGLNPMQHRLKIRGQLAKTNPASLTAKQAWRIAKRHRADLKMAALQAKQTAYLLALQRRQLFGEIGLGATYEKELDHDKTLGPLLSFQLPIFHQNQAQIARAQYLLRQHKKQQAAKVLAVKEEIVTALQDLTLYHQQAGIYQQMLAAQTDSTAFAKAQVNQMLMNRFALIQAQRERLQAQKQYLSARHDYQAAKIHLQSTIGKLF